MEGYRQTTEYTTAAAGLLAIIHAADATFACAQENELEIWRSSVNLPTRASSIFGLAVFARQHGLSPRVIVESLEYDYPDYRFHRYTKKDIELAQEMHGIHVAQARKAEIPIEVRGVAFSEIKQQLIAGKTLLLRINEGVLRGTGSTSKYVVLYGYRDGNFLVLDPVQEQPLIAVSEDDLRESFETLATKKKRDHRMILF